MLKTIRFYINEAKFKHYSKMVRMSILHAELAEQKGDTVSREYWVDKAEKYLDKEWKAHLECQKLV